VVNIAPRSMYCIAIQILKCFLKSIKSWYTASFAPSLGFDPRTFKPVASRYSDYANPVHSIQGKRSMLLSCHVPSVVRTAACGHSPPPGQNDAGELSSFSPKFRMLELIFRFLIHFQGFYRDLP
jgi:hypothetical protein